MVVTRGTAKPSEEHLDEEAVLLSQAGRGEAQAFRVLVDRNLRGVYRVALRILADEAEAEDVAQETMLKLWRAAGTLEIGENGVGPWLRRVAANQAIDRLRNRKRFEVTDTPPDPGIAPTQLHEMSENEVALRVRSAISSLPARQRTALSLFHFEGMGQRDVAAALEISEEAVESLLARARRKLKDVLQGEWRELLSPSKQD